MYKIVSNLSIVNQLNAAVANKEKNEASSYCPINANIAGNKWAIPITEYLQFLKAYCDILTDDWFSTDTVETLPSDWYWHKPNYPIRIVIDKLKLADEKLDKTDFYALASQMMDEFTTDNQLVNETDKVFIYVTHIDTDKQTLLDEAVSRGTITIEKLTNL